MVYGHSLATEDNMTTEPKLYVNVFRNRERLEAHDGVFHTRWEAVDAAKEYAAHYEVTLTDLGQIDLSSEFVSVED